MTANYQIAPANLVKQNFGMKSDKETLLPYWIEHTFPCAGQDACQEAIWCF
jgi:hypothetical protein